MRNLEVLTAEALQYSRSLVRLDIECCWPEGFRANLIRQAVDRHTELVYPVVDLVEASLAAGLRFPPHDRFYQRRMFLGSAVSQQVTGRGLNITTSGIEVQE